MNASKSTEQQAMESVILTRLNAKLGLSLAPGRLTFFDEVRVELDGLDEDRRIACEVYAHIGRLKGSQPDKVASDLLKLNFIESATGHRWRKIICFADSEAAKRLRNKSWLAEATRVFGVEVHDVTLHAEYREKLLDAQRRQEMTNK